MKDFARSLGFWDMTLLFISAIASAGLFLFVLLILYREYASAK